MPIDFSQERWEKIKADARDWWDHRLDRPLIAAWFGGRDPGRPRPATPLKRFISHYDFSVTPEEIADARMYEIECMEFLGDGFPAVFMNFGPGIAAGFLGCRVLSDDHTTWFKPPEPKPIAEIELEYDPDNVWYRRVRDVKQACRDRFDGLVQISMTDLGGNQDILASFVGTEQLLVDLLAEPDEVHRLTWQIHENWMRYYNEFLDLLGPKNPGVSSWAGIYCETSTYMLQSDFCYMIGTPHFDEFVKPELTACCRKLDHPFYHLDGVGQLPHLDSLLEIEELDGVQWVPGAGTRPPSEWPEVYRKIRDAGKLIQMVGSAEQVLAGLHMLDRELGTCRGVQANLRSAGQVSRDDILEALRRYRVI